MLKKGLPQENYPAKKVKEFLLCTIVFVTYEGILVSYNYIVGSSIPKSSWESKTY